MGSSWQPGPQVCVACLLCLSSCPPASRGLPILTPAPPAMGQNFLLGLMVSSLLQGPPGIPGPPGPPGMPGLQVKREKRSGGQGNRAHALCQTPSVPLPCPNACMCHFSLLVLPLPRVVWRTHWSLRAGCVYSQTFFEECPVVVAQVPPLTPVSSLGLGQLSGTQNLGQLTILDTGAELTILEQRSTFIHATKILHT